MQINTSPVLNLSTEFENEVFENESLGISEHHTKIFSNKIDNFIENEEVFAEFKECFAFENNRYCVNLPFNNYSEVLPDNFNVARSRLISLKRKLNSNPTLLHEYDQIMKDYLKDNIIEEANGNKVVTSAHYLPHHAEIKSGRESTKTRIVFDALAKSDKNEPSLNDILYNGPCLLPLIEDVLLKFRLGRIGVVADMQQVFLQISVNECHRNYLRFLWYNNMFDENSLKVYRSGRVLFRLTCSPFLVNGTVMVHVEKHVHHETRAVLEKFLRVYT